MASAKDGRLDSLLTVDQETLPAELQRNKKLLRKSQLHLLLSYMREELEVAGPVGIPILSLLKLLTIDDMLNGALFEGLDEENVQQMQ